MSENDDIEVDSDVGGLVSLSKWLVKKHNIPASLRYLIELASELARGLVKYKTLGQTSRQLLKATFDRRFGLYIKPWFPNLVNTRRRYVVI